MHLRNCLLLTLGFLLSWPVIRAQEKFEINVGISTPGIDEMRDTRWYYLGTESFDIYHDVPLNDLEESFNTTLFPCYSLEFSYDLAESGFFKRLDLVGIVSYHSAIMEEIDIINNTSTKKTARKVDLLIGLRYIIFQKEKLGMYAQLLAGGDFRNSSAYWDYIYSDYEDNSPTTMQLTLGFNRKIGGPDSKWSFMTELGYGTEYALSIIPIFLASGWA